MVFSVDFLMATETMGAKWGKSTTIFVDVYCYIRLICMSFSFLGGVFCDAKLINCKESQFKCRAIRCLFTLAYV